MFVKVSELTPDMNEVNIKVRVLEAGELKEIQTFRGERTLSEAVVGDETGRITLTLWGEHAGKVSAGDAIEIKNGYTRVFRGELRLNLGSRGTIEKIADSEVPSIEEVPEISPQVPEGYEPRRRGGRDFRRGRSYSRRRY
ncbi:MAG: single-stranded DNA-binding protein [Thermoproteota archaeon]|nr:MAG: single-stranded DNA-binding protein [Candidatus Korarchaeota archaeon]